MTRKKTADTTAITFYNLLVGEIARAFDVAETASPKPGGGGLKILEAATDAMGDEGIFPEEGSDDDDEEER